MANHTSVMTAEMPGMPSPDEEAYLDTLVDASGSPTEAGLDFLLDAAQQAGWDYIWSPHDGPLHISLFRAHDDVSLSHGFASAWVREKADEPAFRPGYRIYEDEIYDEDQHRHDPLRRTVIEYYGDVDEQFGNFMLDIIVFGQQLMPRTPEELPAE